MNEDNSNSTDLSKLPETFATRDLREIALFLALWGQCEVMDKALNSQPDGTLIVGSFKSPEYRVIVKQMRVNGEVRAAIFGVRGDLEGADELIAAMMKMECLGASRIDAFEATTGKQTTLLDITRN